MGMKTKTASRLIARHGQAASLLRPGEGTTDGFGGYTPGPDTAYPCTVFIAAYTVNEEFIAAGLLDVGDSRVLLSVEGLAIQPETTDKIQVGDTILGIATVTPHAPGGVIFFYEIKARDLV